MNEDFIVDTLHKIESMNEIFVLFDMNILQKIKKMPIDEKEQE
jgi:hypothetical protein